MTLRQLEYFVLIAEKGSYTAAAAQAHVSQPSMSQHISQLSKELGVLLFEKDTLPLKLTPDGAYLFEKAKIMLAARNQISQRFERAAKRRTLNIGVSDVGALLHAAIFPLFHSRHPQTDVILHEGDFTTLQKRLCKGELDILLSSRPKEDSRIVVHKTLFDRMALALRSDDPLAAAAQPSLPPCGGDRVKRRFPSLEISVLAHKAFILAGPPSYKNFQRSFLQEHFTPTITLETEKIATGLSLLKSAGGALLLPELYARFYEPGDQISFFSLRSGTPTWELCLSVPAKGRPSKGAETYLSLIVDLAEVSLKD